LLGLGLAGSRAIGLGFPSGKGKGAEAGKVLGAGDGGPSEEVESEALGAGLLLSPQNQTACEGDNDSGVGLGAGAGERRARSTPPGAWRGVAGVVGAGAGRSRSLGGSGLGGAWAAPYVVSSPSIVSRFLTHPPFGQANPRNKVKQKQKHPSIRDGAVISSAGRSVGRLVVCMCATTAATRSPVFLAFVLWCFPFLSATYSLSVSVYAAALLLKFLPPPLPLLILDIPTMAVPP
jgi:hypothetical protein